ncbi:MAG: ATP-binding protein [Candidatus Omnitrophica bacterium]|nr:ATP-binding protein [Candidatus Omnitrophota bacterium]
MVRRLIGNLIRKKLGLSPAVALLGPRQAGKTTLAKTFSKTYFDLEQSEERLKLDLAWNDLLAAKELIVLDEVQAWPEILPRIRGAIDAHRKRQGRFLLTGSVAPGLMRGVSESLAGRLSICELAPLSLKEIPKESAEGKLWLRGGFPNGGILDARQFPSWQRDYLTLLAQRDLPIWGLPAKPQVTQRLFKMLAIHHGQVWNASEIGKSLGLSYHTVSSYLDYLQNAYLISSLQPYFRNLRKRITKRPKIYWQDSGLLHSLMGVTTPEALLSQPWVGASWEGWVIHQILFYLKARGEPFEAYYLRTGDGYELDLILFFSKGCWAFEIKLSTSPDPRDLKRLNTAADFIKADKRLLISKTKQTIQSKSSISTHLAGCIELLSK